jgi:hypothetical protein
MYRPCKKSSFIPPTFRLTPWSICILVDQEEECCAVHQLLRLSRSPLAAWCSVILFSSIKHHEAVLESTATMSFNLRTPTLALTGLSMCLCLAIIGTAGRSLHVYYNQHTTNPWLLPVWPNHFDTRELQMLIGTSAGVVVCNAVLVLGLLVKKVRPLLVIGYTSQLT